MESQPLTAAEVAHLFESVAFATGNPLEQFRGFDTLLVARREFVARAAQTVLLRQVPLVWTNGWQPAELHRQVHRATNGAGAKLTLGLIANDHDGRDGATIDRRWSSQLSELGVPAGVDPDWIVHWSARRTDDDTTLALLIDMVRAIANLRPLAILIPPPGTTAGTEPVVDLHSPVDDPKLDRVRALLAKAESTEFEAEAEAFTAKAQELMARYSIDAAMLSARTANPDAPVTVRIPVDNPYADAKSLLCQIVAEHSRARAVRLTDYGMSTVIGFAPDVAATEILFTSLLVQAQTAMQSTVVTAAGTRARSAAFRSAFFLAYAHRVGERLAEINAHVADRAARDLGTSLVPVLTARNLAVDHAVHEQFGQLSESRPRGARDAAGWASGRLAADGARLNLADIRPSGRSRADRSRLTR
ncbi:MAG: DUF2786 domain-containing protein [Acidimicrobiia bacterium]